MLFANNHSPTQTTALLESTSKEDPLYITNIRIDLLSLSSPLTSGHFWYTFSPALVLGQQRKVSNTIGQNFSVNVAEMEKRLIIEFINQTTYHNISKDKPVLSLLPLQNKTRLKGLYSISAG